MNAGTIFATITNLEGIFYYRDTENTEGSHSFHKIGSIGHSLGVVSGHTPVRFNTTLSVSSWCPILAAYQALEHGRSSLHVVSPDLSVHRMQA